ncbi:MAG: hypothetical protein IJ800_01825 [Clostridia bacterium]|nr:hypothetical protein [Clostridia bacterium]
MKKSENKTAIVVIIIVGIIIALSAFGTITATNAASKTGKQTGQQTNQQSEQQPNESTSDSSDQSEPSDPNDDEDPFVYAFSLQATYEKVDEQHVVTLTSGMVYFDEIPDKLLFTLEGQEDEEIDLSSAKKVTSANNEYYGKWYISFVINNTQFIYDEILPGTYRMNIVAVYGAKRLNAATTNYYLRVNENHDTTSSYSVGPVVYEIGIVEENDTI